MLRRRILYSAIIFACIGAPIFVEWLITPPPSTRKIHIEAFRYGTSPVIIRANRGDRLILTFSTLDTGHSFFLQDYRIDAKISPASETVEVRDPLQSTEPPAYVREIHLKAGLSGLWGSLVSISRFRCHVYCGPMHGFEQGDLIVRPNWLMAGSMGLLLAIVIIGYLRIRRKSYVVESISKPPIDLNKRFVLIDKLLKWRPLQFTFTLPLLAGLVVVLLAGLFGTKVGGRNVAVMLTWIVWISMLALFLVPLGGRIWCMICPLPVMGEYLQRGATTEVRAGRRGRFGNLFFGWGRHWPRVLSGPWLRVFFFPDPGYIECLSGRTAQMDCNYTDDNGSSRDIDLPCVGDSLFLPICLSGGCVYFSIQHNRSAHGSKEKPSSLQKLQRQAMFQGKRQRMGLPLRFAGPPNRSEH